MSNDIRDIIERLAILEGRVTPTTVKSGLNPQQQSVPQLPALFKPKHISVLGAKKDPEHPMHDYAVGASESEESEEDVLEELLADTQTMKDLVMQVFEAAQAEGREDIANFMAERQDSHGKYMWQLKSFLKDARA